MELKKGVCFFCSCDKIVIPKESDFLKKAFGILFQENVLKVKDSENFTSVTLCPMCYHKINLLLETTNKIHKIQPNKDNCSLCTNKDTVVNIKDWKYFSQISEDFNFNEEDECYVCVECLFYMDMRHLIKEKLLSKYDDLTNNEVETRRPRFLKVTTFQKMRSRQSPNKNNIDLSKLKSFKSLKSDRSLKKLKFINEDPKFFSQIPYVLLKIWNICGTKSKTKINSPSRSPPSNFFKIKLKESVKKTTPTNRNVSKASKASSKHKKPCKVIDFDDKLFVKLTKLDTNTLESGDKPEYSVDKEENQIKENGKNYDIVNGDLEKTGDDLDTVQEDSREELEDENTTEDEELPTLQTDALENHSNSNNISEESNEDNTEKETETPDTNGSEQPSNDRETDTNKDIVNNCFEEGLLNFDASNQDGNLDNSINEIISATEAEDNNENDDTSEKVPTESEDIENNEDDEEKSDRSEKLSLTLSDKDDEAENDTEKDNDDEDCSNLKRKRFDESGSDIGISPDKKKKRVTFSDDV